VTAFAKVGFALPEKTVMRLDKSLLPSRLSQG